MKAFIMAGGKGTRLVTLTKDLIPKPLVKVVGKPILERTIETLKQNGVDEVYISVNHLAGRIIDYFKDGADFGVKIHYIVENEPLGSGGALYYLKGKVEEDFIVCSGDTIFDIDIAKMVEFHKAKHSKITMLVHPNSHPFDSDLVECSADSRVKRLSFKNSQRDYFYKNLVNAGFFIVEPSCLSFFTTRREVNMEHDFINHFIERGDSVFAYKSPEYIKDVGTVKRFVDTEQDILNKVPERKNLKNKQRAIFLDRDGTINKYKGYITNADDFELADKVEEAIRKINQSDFLAIVVTNQPVVARGDCTQEELENIFKKMETLLGSSGAYVDGIYYCPHHPNAGFVGEVPELKIDCDCRKPKIGLLTKAQADFNLDLEKCYIVGDSHIDVQTGKNAKIPQVKVKSDLIENKAIEPTFYAENLLDAVDIILEKERNNEKRNSRVNERLL